MVQQDASSTGAGWRRGRGRSWSRALRRVLTHMLGPSTTSAAGPPPVSERLGWVIDCAVYVGGHRQPDQLSYASAARATQRRGDGFVWLGLYEPTEAELTDVARVFRLHELAVQDALATDARPKIERYGEVTYFVLRTTRYVEHPTLTDTSEVVETGTIMIFVGPRFVITVRHGAPGALGQVRADLEDRRDLLAQGPWAVAHAVCDRLVDTYLEVSAAVEADLDAIEEAVFAPRRSGDVAQVYQLKREIMEFKRAVYPLQRPLAALIDDRDLLPKGVRGYFRDVNDHLLRAVERVASFDDLLNSVLQARLAQVTVDQNNDMRKIAAWAAIAAMQTAIAGIYGMNFDVMPELRWRYGYPTVVAVMVVSAIVLYRRFRRAGWL